jgi:hypothetical protein
MPNIDIEVKGRADLRGLLDSLKQAGKEGEGLRGILEKAGRQIRELGSARTGQDLTQALSKAREEVDRLEKEIAAGGGGLPELNKQLEEARANVTNLEGQIERSDDTRGGMAGQIGGFAQQNLGRLATLTAGGLGAGAMYSRVAGGLESYREHIKILDDEARAVKALGRSYAEYRDEVLAAGRAHGFHNDQVIALNRMIARTEGRAGAEGVADQVQVQAGFARAYGMDLMESGGYFRGAAQMGITSGRNAQLEPRQFAALIADAVSAGEMGQYEHCCNQTQSRTRNIILMQNRSRQKALLS